MFWQCSLCGVVGYRKHTGYKIQSSNFRAKVLMCYVTKCKEDAVGRVKGRSSHGRLKWSCREHLTV